MRSLIRASKNFVPAMALALEIHAYVHACEVSGSSTPTLMDAIS